MAHPYYPRDMVLPNYVPNISPMTELLGIFFGLVAIVIICLLVATKTKTTGVRVKICWFVVSGLIHSILEGYFSVFHATLVGKSTYLAQMWKEYGKGDSRYLISDSFMVSMESITAFVDGPLCLLTAYAYYGGHLSKFRYVFQLMVSICQLYGDTMYFGTEILEGFKHSEMWHPLHFWFYFVFLNSFWIIVPLIFITDAVRNLSQSQAIVDNKKLPVRSSARNGKKIK